jgi:hypothetical protein
LAYQPPASSTFLSEQPTTSNQPAVLFSQNKPAPAISHQPTEQAESDKDLGIPHKKVEGPQADHGAILRQDQWSGGLLTRALFVRSHQPAVLFSQNKPATNNQPAVLFSQNKSAPAISHQPNEQADGYTSPETAQGTQNQDVGDGITGSHPPRVRLRVHHLTKFNFSRVKEVASVSRVMPQPKIEFPRLDGENRVPDEKSIIFILEC